MLKLKKKVSFVLLEVMIALVLTVLLAVPVIRSSFFGYKKQLEDVKKFEIEKVFNDTYAQALENLYMNKPSWEKLEKKGPKQYTNLPSYNLPFNKGNFLIERRYKVKCHDGKKFKSNENHKYRIFEIHLEIAHCPKDWDTQDKINKRIYYVLGRNVLQ